MLPKFAPSPNALSGVALFFIMSGDVPFSNSKLCYRSGASNVSVRAARIVLGRTTNPAVVGKASKTSSRGRSRSCIECRPFGFALPVCQSQSSSRSIWIATSSTVKWRAWKNKKRSLISAEGERKLFFRRGVGKPARAKN